MLQESNEMKRELYEMIALQNKVLFNIIIAIQLLFWANITHFPVTLRNAEHPLCHSPWRSKGK